MSSNEEAATAPLSSSFVPSSWSSTLGVADAIASYRRSQFIITNQNVTSAGVGDQHEDSDEEAQYGHETVLEFMGEEDTLSCDEDPMINNMDWDEDLQDHAEEHTMHTQRHALRRPTDRLQRDESHMTVTPHDPRFLQIEGPSEQTPLLHKVISRSSMALQLPRTRRENGEIELDASITLDTGPRPSSSAQDGKARLKRKLSSTSARSEKQVTGGRSTFGQTLFNSIAILLGIGMLSEPLAFAYAGWVGGAVLIISLGLITCYTAKILACIMIEDPQIRTYADIGNKAFGQRSRFFTSSLFCLELFAVSVVLVTLYGDSLHSIAPRYSADTYKVLGLIILVPSVFCPLSVLSYTSIIGILSTLLIIGVVFIDGLSKLDAPGSLWSPAETRFGIAGGGELGIAFGLFMAGFSGHAVLPSLARDMADPRDFNRMINWAFITATLIYATIGGSGYLMFGKSVSDEISRDLLATPGYNLLLNQLCVWSLVIMPLTKFALTTRPVNITLEIILGLESVTLPQIQNHDGAPPGFSVTQANRPRNFKDIFIVIERVIFTCMSVAVSILIPEFSSMMAFLGSFSALMICIIGPVSAKIALAGRCGWGDAGLLIGGTIMVMWGTVAAFVA